MGTSEVTRPLKPSGALLHTHSYCSVSTRPRTCASMFFYTALHCGPLPSRPAKDRISLLNEVLHGNLGPLARSSLLALLKIVNPGGLKRTLFFSAIPTPEPNVIGAVGEVPFPYSLHLITRPQSCLICAWDSRDPLTTAQVFLPWAAQIVFI